MSICNKDCFHCPYPDCINDEMDHDDYIESAARDKELRSTPEKRKLAAKQKAYREANRTEIAAKKKAYREANRSEIAAKKKAYYEANRTEIAAKQKIVRDTRSALGLSQTKAAEILGVTKSTVSLWENGNVPCDTAAVVLALRSAIQEKPPAEMEARQAEGQILPTANLQRIGGKVNI